MKYPKRTGKIVAALVTTLVVIAFLRERQAFEIVQDHVSLTPGQHYALTLMPSDASVRWFSDNPRVHVDAYGTLLATDDTLGEDARATVTATSLKGNSKDTCQVTIVDWQANLSKLEVVATPSAQQILGSEGSAVYFAKGSALHVTHDGFETSKLLSKLPETPIVTPLLATPFGYFLRCGPTIYKSSDLTSWEPSFVMNMRGLVHGLACDWDESTQTGYLYAGEYSTNPADRHAVYRGIFCPGAPADWQKVLEFASLNEWRDDPTIANAARHVHTVAVDPYTGHVWLGTGDDDAHSRIMVSTDRGTTFHPVGMGSQTWRTLSIWFTQRYVYWNMDTTEQQSIWRLPRGRFAERGTWPTMTPELASGTTKSGQRYLVTSSATEGRFPVPAGRIYTETTARRLDANHQARPLGDPDYHYREEVVQLVNGALWYHLWARDEMGEPLLILGGSPEGALRDYRGRVFGIKELPDGSVDVQELLSVGSSRPGVYDKYTRYTQLIPAAQDARGFLYFTGRQTPHPVYKTRLRWTSNGSSGLEMTAQWSSE